MDLKWKIVIAIAVIIILIIIWKKYSYKFSNLFQDRNVDFESSTNTDDISESRKTYLNSLASTIKSELYGVNVIGFGHNLDPFKEANSLSDIELLYLSRYYKRYLTNGTTLHEDIGSDFWGGNNEVEVSESLERHLEKIGER